jgi:hypothetical protein
LTSTIRRWASFTLSRGAPRDFRERRARGVFQGTASGVAWRIVAILVSVVSVPLTIRYFGSERLRLIDRDAKPNKAVSPFVREII